MQSSCFCSLWQLLTSTLPYFYSARGHCCWLYQGPSSDHWWFTWARRISCQYWHSPGRNQWRRPPPSPRHSYISEWPGLWNYSIAWLWIGPSLCRGACIAGSWCLAYLGLPRCLSRPCDTRNIRQKFCESLSFSHLIRRCWPGKRAGRGF